MNKFNLEKALNKKCKVVTRNGLYEMVDCFIFEAEDLMFPLNVLFKHVETGEHIVFNYTRDGQFDGSDDQPEDLFMLPEVITIKAFIGLYRNPVDGSVRHEFFHSRKEAREFDKDNLISVTKKIFDVELNEE